MRKLLALILAPLLVAVLGACGGAGGTSNSPGGALRMGISYAATTLDPDLLPIQQMWVYLDPVYDSLTTMAPDGQVKPLLASEWTAGEDGGTYYMDMKLQDGLVFPDGAPFNADTVVTNVHRSVELKGSKNSTWFEGITVEKLGEYEVRFSSKTGVGQLPSILAGPAGMMISQKAIAEKADLTKHPVGIGPYTVESVEPNRIAYKANDHYRNQNAVGADRLELVSMSDDAMLGAVLAGDVHIASLPFRMVETAANADFIDDIEPGNINMLWAVNATIEPFDDPRVREALSLALDRKSFCENVWDGQCTPASQFFGPRSPYYDDKAEVLPFNLEQARELVEQAGATGTQFEIVVPAGIAQHVELATYAQGQWEKIGLKPKVTQLPPPQVVGRFTQEQNVAVTIGGAGLAFDPSVEMSRYVLASGLYNIGNAVRPEIEELAKQGLLETDQATRQEIYQKLSTLSVQDGLLIPIVCSHNVFVVSPDVLGWKQPWSRTFMTVRGVGLSS